MKMSWKAISVALFALSQSVFAAQIENSTYNIDVNLDDVSRGDLSGQFHLTLKLEVSEPNMAEIETITVSGDEGPVTYQQLSVQGDPILRYHGLVTRASKPGGALLPVTEFDIPTRLVTTNPPLNRNSAFDFDFGENTDAIVALPLSDDHGVPFFLNMDFSRRFSLHLSGLGRNPIATSTSRHSTALEFRATAVRRVSFATQYTLVGRYLPGPGESSPPCSHVGESRWLRSMYGSERRLEYCYPSMRLSSGLERIVLPISGMTPTDDLNDGLKRLLGGPLLEEVRVDANTIRTRSCEGQYRSHIAEHPLLNVSNPLNMNCHGYAIRATLSEDRLALPPEANWIEGSCPTCAPHWAAEGTYPLLAILERNYDRVASFTSFSTLNFEPLRKIMRDPRLKPGDLIVLSSSAGLVHSAVLVPGPTPDMLWLEGKFESGPVVDSPIEAVVTVYPPSEITVYRPKPGFQRYAE